MSKTLSKRICKQCGARGAGKFCGNCGQSLEVKRLTTANIFHEIFHFFTYLDKGFPYTLKKLALAPGNMQKDYVNGQRGKNQQPFSMYFVCGTLTALALYIIHRPTGNISHFEEVQGDFTRHYYVIVQSILLPFYAFVTWVFFKSKNFNYAESLVLLAYALSFMFLLVVFTNLIDLIPHKRIAAAYYEIPVLFLYLLWTYFNFFKDELKWRITIKTVLTILICYFASNLAGDMIVNRML